MATGKTTVGKLLADQLDYVFVDTDELIVERSGQSVAAIFHEKGEAAFREMEAAVARELSEKEGHVIATGGRLILDAANAAVLTKRGRVFCLVATPQEILQRIQKDKDVKRPLLEAPDPLKRIVEIMQQRESDYSRFPQIATSGKTPAEVTRELFAIFQADPDM